MGRPAPSQLQPLWNQGGALTPAPPNLRHALQTSEPAATRAPALLPHITPPSAQLLLIITPHRTLAAKTRHQVKSYTSSARLCSRSVPHRLSLGKSDAMPAAPGHRATRERGSIWGKSKTGGAAAAHRACLYKGQAPGSCEGKTRSLGQENTTRQCTGGFTKARAARCRPCRRLHTLAIAAAPAPRLCAWRRLVSGCAAAARPAAAAQLPATPARHSKGGAGRHAQKMSGFLWLRRGSLESVACLRCSASE